MAGMLDEFQAWEAHLRAVERSNARLARRLRDAEWSLAAGQVAESQMREESARMQNVIHDLQNSLHRFLDIEDENDALKKTVSKKELELVELEKSHNEKLQKLDAERRVEQEQHELLLASAQQEADHRVAQEAQRMQEVIDQQQHVVEMLKRKLSDVEKQKEVKLLKLQMEHDAKVSKLQSAALLSKQRISGASNHDIFRQKLQHLQESKDQEIATLQRQVAQLERRLQTEQNSWQKRRRI